MKKPKKKQNKKRNTSKSSQKKDNSFKKKVNEILKRKCEYHKEFYEIQIFSGPSRYFHKKTIKLRKKIKRKDFNVDSKTCVAYLESIYATLVSWGMHRMGKGGPKMVDFDEFKKSIKGISSDIQCVWDKKLQDLSEDILCKLKDIFKEIKIMKTNRNLVGNSKVMAHLFPDLVPPIDREYTLLYLKGSRNVPKNEWVLFSKMLLYFFKPLASNKGFKKKAKVWKKNKNSFPWDTSIPKIIDNLVIVAQK